MRYCLLLPILAPMVFVAGQVDDRAVKKDLDKFQGAWQAISVINVDGKPASEDDARYTRLVVKGNTFTLQDKNAMIRGTFSIDPTRVPKTIDVTLDGAKPEDKILGIYRIDGDLRRSCFVPPGKERPRDFPSDGKGFLQFVWKPQPK
jgi:uncharacterized protein (TIGR03067 family)